MFEEAIGRKVSDDFDSQDPDRNLHLTYVNDGAGVEEIKKKKMKMSETETDKKETKADKREIKIESATVEK